MTMLQGVDVSAVQGKISLSQWAAIAARGTAFAIAKCGNGNDRPDPDWSDVLDARAQGLTIGVYHFAYAGLHTNASHPGRDPVDQARAHFAACGGLGSKVGELPACLDAEWPAPGQWGKPVPGVEDSVVTGPEAEAWLYAYACEYERLQGRTPLLYSYPDYLRNLRPRPDFARFPLWLAAYGPSVPAIGPWAGWTLWQTSGGGGRLPNGVPVDTDEADDAAFAAIVGRP